jgi:hypothetical protein
MARGDPDAQRPPPDGEPQRRPQLHRLAIDSGVHRCRGAHLQAWRAPGPPGRAGALAGYIENDDPELAGVERWAGANGRRRIQRVGVVRHEHDGDLAMLAPQVVEQVQRGHLSAWTQHPLCGFQKRAQLGIAIFRPADRVTVDPERDVVSMRSPVHGHRCHRRPADRPRRGAPHCGRAGLSSRRRPADRPAALTTGQAMARMARHRSHRKARTRQALIDAAVRANRRRPRRPGGHPGNHPEGRHRLRVLL